MVHSDSELSEAEEGASVAAPLTAKTPESDGESQGGASSNGKGKHGGKKKGTKGGAKGGAKGEGKGKDRVKKKTLKSSGAGVKTAEADPKRHRQCKFCKMWFLKELMPLKAMCYEDARAYDGIARLAARQNQEEWWEDVKTKRKSWSRWSARTRRCARTLHMVRPVAVGRSRSMSIKRRPKLSARLISKAWAR